MEHIEFDDLQSMLFDDESKLDSALQEAMRILEALELQNMPTVSPEEPVSQCLEDTEEPEKPVPPASEAAINATEEFVEAIPYQLPSSELLHSISEADPDCDSAQSAQSLSTLLEDTLHSFGLKVHVVGYTAGPTVTQVELTLPRGVKIAKLSALSEDICLTLGVSTIRVAPVVGKPGVLGVEIPNKTPAPMSLRTIIESPEFRSKSHAIPFALGMDMSGNPVVCDITQMPHLLIAGTDGFGKTMCIDNLLLSILFSSTPEQTKLLLIDPDGLDFTTYNKLPHLLVPVLRDPIKAVRALQWLVLEINRRYAEIAKVGVRKIEDYNKLAKKDTTLHPMSYIVVAVSEMADLTRDSKGEVDKDLIRIAQVGRAAGVHLVIATRRPTVNAVTGLLKNNLPSRIAFRVSSKQESRIIIDAPGAEQLNFNGDLLYYPIGATEPLRVQGCMVTKEEIIAVVDYIKAQFQKPEFNQSAIQHVKSKYMEHQILSGRNQKDALFSIGILDEKLPEAMEVFLDVGMASTSHLQRRLKLGHSRAGHVMDELEELGLIGPFMGSKPRTILVTREEWELKKQILFDNTSDLLW